MKENNKLTVAAISDIHIRYTSKGKFNEIFEEISQKAQVLLLCGDLTDHGLPEEAEILAGELKACSIPKLAVLGNHDFENNMQDNIKTILSDNNVVLLEDEVFEIQNTGFTGTKGFAGGFGKYMLTAFGEQEIKAFVAATMAEVEKLEIGLGKIEHAEKKVVALHYSPVLQTLKGEPLEIYPFLGNSRLEDVIDRFATSAVFHGHAHFGSMYGKTAKNVPVFNVANSLLQKHGLKYRLVEI